MIRKIFCRKKCLVAGHPSLGVCQCCPRMVHSILSVITDPIHSSICPYGTCYQHITIFLPIADDLDFDTYSIVIFSCDHFIIPFVCAKLHGKCIWYDKCTVCTVGCFTLYVCFSTFSLVQGKAIFGNDNGKQSSLDYCATCYIGSLLRWPLMWLAYLRGVFTMSKLHSQCFFGQPLQFHVI